MKANNCTIISSIRRSLPSGITLYRENIHTNQ
jgi:hypothetical protein